MPTRFKKAPRPEPCSTSFVEDFGDGGVLLRLEAQDGSFVEERERELFIDNLLVRIHFIIVMIRWTGLAP